MKKFGFLLIIFVVGSFADSDTSKCIKRTGNSLDYNGFLNRDNSNITYLISNNGTEIEACEYVTEISNCDENGVINKNQTVKSYVSLRYYTQDGNVSDISKFNSDFNCLNYLIHDKERNNKSKIFIKKYSSTNNDLTETITSEQNDTSDIETLCNKFTVPLIRHIDAITYPEIYRSEISFIKSKSIQFMPGVSVAYLHDPSLSFYSKNYTKIVDKYAFTASWSRKWPSQDLKLPAGSGKILTMRVRNVNKIRKYTANFVIDESLPEEDSRRFKAFRRKLRSGEVTLHQNLNGIYIDFSDDYEIVLRNLPVRENVIQGTRKYSLRDAKTC